MNELINQIEVPSQWHGLLNKLLNQKHIENLENDDKFKLLIGFVNDILKSKLES